MGLWGRLCQAGEHRAGGMLAMWAVTGRCPDVAKEGEDEQFMGTCYPSCLSFRHMCRQTGHGQWSHSLHTCACSHVDKGRGRPPC